MANKKIVKPTSTFKKAPASVNAFVGEPGRSAFVGEPGRNAFVGEPGRSTTLTKGNRAGVNFNQSKIKK